MKLSRKIAVCLLFTLTGCEQAGTSAAVRADASAAPIGSAECAVCNMVVREQPSPRTQVVHSDGTRGWLCSVDELVQVLGAPSPHGEVQHAFVEVADPSLDPSETSPVQRPWKPAKDAWYVLGVKRKGIMGPPVVAYEHKPDAEKIARDYGGDVFAYDQLRTRLIEQANEK